MGHLNEPDEKDWEHKGMRCILRRGYGGSWCGYVMVKSDHPWFEKKYHEEVYYPSASSKSIDLDKVGPMALMITCLSDSDSDADRARIDILMQVHGGITYSGRRLDDMEEGWCFGFDCAHLGDFSPKYAEFRGARGDDLEVYRDINYVTKETELLADQLDAIKN